MQPDVAVGADGLIAEDAPCGKCSYNLRGLPTEGRCPECGTSVGWSIHGHLLHFSDPVWVQHLAGGALWMIWSVFLGIGLTIVGVGIDAWLSARAGAGAGTTSSLAGVVASGVGLVAYWKLTMR